MANKKILVTEDDKVLLNLIRDALTAEGFEAIGAQNGQEGLDLALKMHPDLILADIIMPVMDGMEMTTKLREDEWGKKVPIVIITGKEPDNERLEQINHWDPAYYFVKGNQSSEVFISTLQDLIKGDQTETQQP